MEEEKKKNLHIQVVKPESAAIACLTPNRYKCVLKKKTSFYIN